MEKTRESESRNPEAEKLRACGNCGSHELRRSNRTFPERVLCRQSYHCYRCKNRFIVFRPSLVAFAAICLIPAVVALFIFIPRLPIFNVAADANAAARSQSAAEGPEKTGDQQAQTVVDNAAILRMWQAKVSVPVILRAMKKSRGNYDVSPNAIIALREAQVDEAIILEMINKSTP